MLGALRLLPAKIKMQEGGCADASAAPNAHTARICTDVGSATSQIRLLQLLQCGVSVTLPGSLTTLMSCFGAASGLQPGCRE